MRRLEIGGWLETRGEKRVERRGVGDQGMRTLERRVDWRLGGLSKE